MSPILCYGIPLGSSVGLIAAFEWLGAPYRLTRVDMLDEMRAPAYAAINPRHETPVLITPTGGALTETMAIAAWLEARDDARHISFAPLSRDADRMKQLMGFVNSSFTGSFAPLWAALEMAPPDPELQAGLRRHGARGVEKRHDQLESMIGDTPFLVGERPCLADALLMGVARWLDFHGVAPGSRWPKLAAWRARIEADPAVRFALDVENGVATSGGACLGHVPLAEVL